MNDHDAMLYAELYRREEPRIREVASAVRDGRLSRTEGRAWALAIFAAIDESFRARTAPTRSAAVGRRHLA